MSGSKSATLEENAVSQGKSEKYLSKARCGFSGYVNGSTPDEWITVDDMGYVDEEGFLYISGRENGMIVYGGLNIFPEEIERVLRLPRG